MCITFVDVLIELFFKLLCSLLQLFKIKLISLLLLVLEPLCECLSLEFLL